MKLGNGESVTPKESMRIEDGLGNIRASNSFSHAWCQFVWSLRKVVAVLIRTVGFLEVGWCCRGMFVREIERVEMRGRQPRVESQTNINYHFCHSL